SSPGNGVRGTRGPHVTGGSRRFRVLGCRGRGTPMAAATEGVARSAAGPRRTLSHSAAEDPARLHARTSPPARVISRRTRRTPAYSAVPAGSTSALPTPPGGPREPLDEGVRDRLAWGEGDAGRGGVVARGRDLFGVLGDGVREEVEAALLAERGVARDDRAADRAARHVVRP